MGRGLVWLAFLACVIPSTLSAGGSTSTELVNVTAHSMAPKGAVNKLVRKLLGQHEPAAPPDGCLASNALIGKLQKKAYQC